MHGGVGGGGREANPYPDSDQGFDEHGWTDRVRKLNEEKRKENR
jgi:hypothetical protein